MTLTMDDSIGAPSPTFGPPGAGFPGFYHDGRLVTPSGSCWSIGGGAQPIMLYPDGAARKQAAVRPDCRQPSF